MAVFPGGRSFQSFAGTESADMDSMPSLAYSTISSGTENMDFDIPIEGHQARIQAFGEHLQNDLQRQRLLTDQRPRQQQGQERQHGLVQQEQQQQQEQALFQAQHFPLYSIQTAKQQEQLYQYHNQQQQQQQQYQQQQYQQQQYQQQQQRQQQQYQQPQQRQQQHQPVWPRHADLNPALTPAGEHSAETEMPSMTFSQDTSTMSSSTIYTTSPRPPPLASLSHPPHATAGAALGTGARAAADGLEADHEYFLTSTLSMIPPEMTVSFGSPLAHYDYITEFAVQGHIAKGGNGEVWVAHWGTRNCVVILKGLLSNKYTPAKTALLFDKEVEVMRMCGNHDNLVQFYGIATRSQPSQVDRFMIMRYYGHGDLVNLLRKPSSQPDAPSMLDKLDIALDIALGLDHLFQCGFHHGDLHPKNILIDDRQIKSPLDQYRGRYQARLTDFGLRRIRGNKNAVSSQPLAGVPPFMAPERLFSKIRPRYNVQSDIFALGVIYWYLMSGRYPVRDPANKIPIAREARVEGTPDWYHALYTKAWSEDPKDRQESLEEIIQVFEHNGISRKSPSSARSSNPNHPRNKKPAVPNGLPARTGRRR